MFNDSNNFIISGGTFNVTHAAQKGKDLLKQGIASGAFHNSDERYDAPKCHPRTRLAVIKTITTWIEDRQKTSFIMWLYGPAGTGKSSIAQTIALQLENLAASFFWSRSSPGRNDEKRLIVSLAYQLVIAIPQMEIHVEEAIRNDPALPSRSLEVQMKALVVEPLRKAFLNQEGPTDSIGNPRLIILDGLDECGTPRAQRYILNVIATAVQSLDFPVPILFLIASRPEQEIRSTFNDQPLLSITTRLALDDTYRPDDDIKLFLVDEFASLKKTHILGRHLSATWPTAEAIETLVQKSSGQFIYAATVVKFVKSTRSRPEEQLDIILGITETGKHTPFAELDALYIHIFRLVEDRPRALEILSCFFLMEYYGVFHDFTANFFQEILSYKPGDFHLILSDLHSILDVPDISNDRRVLRVFHASLRDFLMDPNRAKEFYMDQSQAHARLTQCFLRYMYKLPRPEEQHTRLLVCFNLAHHCLNSYPTEELLQDFFKFDLEKWIGLMVSNSVVTWACYNDIFLLTSWFQKQESAVTKYFGAGKSLYDHQSLSRRMAINFICKTIFSQFHETEIGKYQITAITHPRILQGMDFSPIFSLLDNAILETDEHQALHVDFLLGHPKSYWYIPTEEEILEFQQFLSDPERSGDYFVHGGMYANFSLQITKTLFGGKSSGLPDFKRRQQIRTAVESLPFFLSNANYSPELTEHLLSWNSLSKEDTLDLDLDMKLLQDAIGLYQKREPPISTLPAVNIESVSDEGRSGTPSMFDTMPGQRNRPTGFRNKTRRISQKVATFFKG